MNAARYILPVAIALLAASIVFHGCALRYEFANLNPRQVTRRDRFSGRIDLCTSTIGADAQMRCTPSSEPVDLDTILSRP